MAHRDGVRARPPHGALAHRGPEKENTMDIAAHIAFFYNEDRIRYLDKLVSNLEVTGQHNHLYIYINKYLKPNIGRGRVNLEVIVTPYLDWRLLRRFYRYLPWTMRQHVDPFYLTW